MSDVDDGRQEFFQQADNGATTTQLDESIDTRAPEQEQREDA